MTVLSTAQRLHLQKFLTSIRNGWDPAGTNAAIVELEQATNNAEVTAVRAVGAAFNPAARLPAAMLHDIPKAATADGRIPRPGRECPEHGGTAWRSTEGIFACCLFERLQSESDEWQSKGAANG